MTVTRPYPHRVTSGLRNVVDLPPERPKVRRRARPDSGLRVLFRKHLPEAMWTTVETGAVAGGVPDSEYCFPGGRQGWVEFKKTDGWAVKKTPAWTSQVGWLSRRARYGGRAFVAVRRLGGPGSNIDELWLYPAREVLQLAKGMSYACEVGRWRGGPLRWDWAKIGEELRL